jgi:uracil-DNA glycosylase family protein
MSAEEFVPVDADLDELRTAVQGCRGCALYKDTTQAVFGDGPGDARILVVGEQPGDIEDRRGLPFVGPAGKLLDRAFEEAGLDRTLMYVTNAVKHFKHRPAAAGKRRIHQTPDRTEIVACRPWLVAEFVRVRPQQVVALGATAAKALLGPAFRVTKEHGVPLPWPASAQRPEDFPAVEGAVLVATIHPSAVLRADDREAVFAGMVTDLKALAGQVRRPSPGE